MQFLKKIQKQVLKIYNNEFACFRLGDDKHLKIYTDTHTHGDQVQVVSSSCTLIQQGWISEEFSHRRERHIEYTVYVQSKTSTRTQLLL